MAALHRHGPGVSGIGPSRHVAGVFPVPLLSESCASRRRSARAPWRSACRKASSLLCSLNWMAGTGDFAQKMSHPGAAVPETSMHEWIRARAMDTAVVAQADEDSMGPDALRTATDEATLLELLRGRGGYDVASGVANHLATFDPLLVALPSDVRDAPDVASLVPQDVAQYLEAESRMLRQDEETEFGLRPVTPYVDPKLRSSRRMQIGFAKDLLRIGLFRATRTRQGTVGVIFAKKKNGALRFILDCRPTNSFCSQTT